MNFSGTVDCINCSKSMTGGGGSHTPYISTTWRECSCGMNAVFYNVKDGIEVSLTTRSEDYDSNKDEEKSRLLSTFVTAGIPTDTVYELVNEYSRNGYPWFLVKTEKGFIKIGWRKRVINIDWSDADIRYTVEDDVTKDDTFCHAWSYDKAVKYLTDAYNSK